MSASTAATLAGDAVGPDLRRITDTIPHMVWVASADGVMEYLNQHVCAYTGLDPDSCVRKEFNWLLLIHPDDRNAAIRAWTTGTEIRERFNVAYRILRHDGVYRWHDTRGVPMLDDDGRIVRWVGTCTDVEDERVLADRLRRAQRETAEALMLSEAVQATAPFGFGVGDRDFRFVYVNETLAALDGVPAAQHIGRRIEDVVPDLWPMIEPPYRQALETGQSVVLEVTTPTPESDFRFWKVTFFPVPVHDEFRGVGIAVVDITEQRRAAVFLSLVVNNIGDGLYTTDTEGRLTSLNRAGAQLLGWDESDLLGRSVYEHVYGLAADGTAPDADRMLRDVLDRGGSVLMTDQVFVRRDGSTFPVSCSVAPLRIGDSVAGVVALFRDASDLRRQQQVEVQARHDQKLESLGRLSAGLAHEINTPIQFVGDNTRFLAEVYQQMLYLLMVYRECMASETGDVLWEERRRRADEAEEVADIEFLATEVPVALQQSLEGVERVATLVRAMKAFSYRESKGSRYADLNDAIRTTVTVARNEVKYVADVVLDLGELPDVLCQVGDLNQVFLNLLVNSADAMEGRDGRGEIRVTTRLDGSAVVISFADDGCGIPDHLRRTVFEPFFTTKGVGKGTGQGLALARAVCEAHGGTIDIDSEPGTGTKFVLRLPINGKQGG